MARKKAQPATEAQPKMSRFQYDVLALYTRARETCTTQSQRIGEWMVQVTDDGRFLLWRAGNAPAAKKSAYTETAEDCAQVLGWPPKGYELRWDGARLQGLLMQGVLL